VGASCEELEHRGVCVGREERRREERRREEKRENSYSVRMRCRRVASEPVVKKKGE